MPSSSRTVTSVVNLNAITRSNSALVFSGHDGEMLSENAPLEEVLRRALGRAGIVEHYLHRDRPPSIRTGVQD